MKKTFAFLISLSIILFILLYSIDFMAKDISYYNNFHNEYKIEEESGLSKEWIESASNSLVEFIKSGDNHNFLKAIFKICVINHDPNIYHLLYVYQYANKTITLIISTHLKIL